MHFGNIVRQIAESYKISVDEMAFLMEKPVVEVLALYEAEEWTSGNIKAASEALNYDFGTYLNRGVDYDFNKHIQAISYHDLLINIKYPVGKEQIFEAWLERTWLMARSLGLEVDK